MLSDVKPAANIGAAQQGPSLRATVGDRLRAISKRVWAAGLSALSGGTSGIDDTAFPSGYMAPHRRGSRQVRNLWHQPF
jgi:hypothetical protein